MRMARPMACALFALAGCATAVDDLATSGAHDASPTREGGHPPRDALELDAPPTETSADVGASDAAATDTTTDDTTVVDSGAPDTGTFDTGFDPTDTAPPPPLDAAPTGGPCLNCSSGTCSSSSDDYSCLLNCLIDGFFDCTYTSGAAKPCKCL